MDSFNFTLVSPERQLLSTEVTMAVIPGERGDMGVLAQHAATIAALRPGLVELYQQGEVSERIYIAGGFANINERGCNVLTEQCIFVRDLNQDEIEQHIRNCLEDLALSHQQEQRAALERDMKLANIQLDIIKRLRGREQA
ncbi:MAG: ATP synthase F1 subunit epsilon [Holosporales bacterium]